MKDLKADEQLLIVEDRVAHLHGALSIYACTLDSALDISSVQPRENVCFKIADEIL